MRDASEQRGTEYAVIGIVRTHAFWANRKEQSAHRHGIYGECWQINMFSYGTKRASGCAHANISAVSHTSHAADHAHNRQSLLQLLFSLAAAPARGELEITSK